MAITARKLKRALSRKWPRPKVGKVDEPHLLLLLTPPNSGSTAIADFLAQLPNAAGLNDKYEGQWLLKGMSSDDRWSADLEIDLASVKSVWMSEIARQRRRGQKLDYLIEKSPPNILRFKQIQSLFGRATTVCNNRNPFANGASIAFRYNGFATLPPRDRLRKAAAIARNWVRRSRLIADAVDASDLPLLTYEAFCQDPMKIFDLFEIQTAETIGVNAGHQVRVKDYAHQEIRNMNATQVAKLTSDELSAMAEILAPEAELLSFFGYDLDPSKA